MVLDGPGAALPRPVHVGQLLERRLRRVSPRALELARAAAVAGSDFSLALAQHILARSALELADAWEELESAQLFRGHAFAHDLVHDAALGLVPQPVAQSLHRTIAGYLETAGGAVERIAFHWRRGHDAARAVPALRAAAQAALALYQRPTALAHLEHAVGFLRDLGQRGEAFAVQDEIVTLLQGHDSGVRHEQAIGALQELAETAQQRVRAASLLAILRHIQGRDGDAICALDAIESQLDAGGRERAEWFNVRGVALRSLGRIDEAIAAHRTALALARSSDVHDDLPGCLNNLALALLEANDAPQAAQSFDESARLERNPMTRARVLNNLAIAREESGQFESALEVRHDALALLRGQDGAEFARANVLISMASNARGLQRYGQALGLLDEAERAGLPPTHWRTSNLHCQRATLWVELGAFDRADAALANAACCATSEVAEADLLITQANYQLARGMKADHLLDRCERILGSRNDRRTIRLYRYRRALAVGAHEARRLAAAELEFEASYGNRAAQVPFALALARACLALGDAEAALGGARRALETMRTVHPLLVTPLEVRYVVWQALRALGDSSAPVLIAALEAELNTIAQRNVPEAYHHSFLRSVRFNRQLLQDAAAATGPAARVVSLKGFAGS